MTTHLVTMHPGQRQRWVIAASHAGGTSDVGALAAMLPQRLALWQRDYVTALIGDWLPAGESGRVVGHMAGLKVQPYDGLDARPAESFDLLSDPVPFLRPGPYSELEVEFDWPSDGTTVLPWFGWRDGDLLLGRPWSPHDADWLLTYSLPPVPSSGAPTTLPGQVAEAAAEAAEEVAAATGPMRARMLGTMLLVLGVGLFGSAIAAGVALRVSGIGRS